jgi:DNA-directed RNA polymerase specialized sigma24 family protein
MSDEISDAVMLERLAAALETMPTMPKAVFVRLRSDDASYGEIAAELRITVGEVERNVAAAMLHLHHGVHGGDEQPK